MEATKKLICRMINEAELSHGYASARVEPPYDDDPVLAVEQAAADATIETAGKILNSLQAEEKETISELEKFIEDEIAKVEEGELYGYEADVFSNPPLALIQGQAKAKISVYKIVLEKIKNLKEGEKDADK
nr:MAG TPA: hypothetical protein [Caudoviricetes sp.]